jgi:fructokinase
MQRNADRPVVFGEVLFDRFEDGTSVLGGAPFNVAWHLRGFGLDPFFVSRVGRDSAGEKVLDVMQNWGMDTGGVQLDDNLPTGMVDVRLESGEPTFHILPRQAYDFIGAAAMLTAMEGINPTLLYHGTLAARNAVSAAALATVRAAIPAVFVDINMRQPWWNRRRVEALLRDTRWLKVNEAELAEVARWIGLVEDPLQAAHKVRAYYGVELLIVTLGAKGACFYSATEPSCGEPVYVDGIADTVGAGDAFSAVTILGFLDKWSPEVTLARALNFAAEICRVQGAMVDDLVFYREVGRRWGLWPKDCTS